MSTKVRFQRHKSAHGRLQSSASSLTAAEPNAHTDSSDRDGVGKRKEEAVEVKKGRSRRVKSARETRLEQEKSDIFPSPPPSAGVWGRTQYGDDYGRKEPVKPVPVRPLSPTRRNNPHPAKPFLQWRHPVCIHPHKKSVSPPEDAWKYISESFYDDYTDTSNTGDAKNEVPVTNLATIEFPGNQKNGTLSGRHGEVAGVRAHLNPRTSRNHHTHTAGPGDSIHTMRPPSPKSRMMHNTVRGNTLPVLREWLKTASSKERELVLQMLTAAHSDDSEDDRLQKAIREVLRPDSTNRVHQWLQSASPSERKTLLGVLETLAVAAATTSSLPQPAQLVLPGPHGANWHQHNPPTDYYRAYTYPVSFHPKVAHHHKTHTHTSSQYSRHSHHHHKHQCHKSHKSSGKDAKTGGSDGDMTLLGKRMGIKRGNTPELWHHKIPAPVTEEMRVIHPASVFLLPHRDRGRHFAIHPEWPTA